MKDKQNDIPYLGCRCDKIMSAKPIINEYNFRMFVYWINERSRIHLKKDIQHSPPPWSDDKIFQNVRFTNVFRELDKETKYIIDKVCSKPELEYKRKIASIFMFRFLNKHQSVDALLPVYPEFDGYMEYCKELIDKFPDDYKPFNKAFMVSGMMGSFNAVVGKHKSSIETCLLYCQHLWKNEYFDRLVYAETAEDIYNIINSIDGLGKFMSYQIFVDMTYCPECPVSENEFVVAGPGCREGLKLIFDKKSRMTPEECLFWLRDNWKLLLERYNIDFNEEAVFADRSEKEMNVMSLQNCCCELSKYHRAWNGGHITKRYRQGENK